MSSSYSDSGLDTRSYQGGGEYWYDVGGGGTVSGGFSATNVDHMIYTFDTSATYADGVWSETGSATVTDLLNSDSDYSAGSQSYAYNYSGTPSLGEEGDWAWSGGSGTSSGVGEATWKKSGTAPYSRTDNATYAVSGTRGESVDQKLSYSYTILASISDGAWALSGTGDNEAKGTAGTSYSGSGSFSSGGFSSFSSENGGASGSRSKATLDFTLRSGLGGHQRLGQHFARLLEESDF